MKNVLQAPIQEIFRSVQGEGYYMGVSSIFVRFKGCNLSCPFCDSKETWQCGTDSDMYTVHEIIHEIRELDPLCKCMLVFTGGEPTIYNDVISAVITTLQNLGESRFTSIETNGTQMTPAVINHVTCSPKAAADYVIRCIPDEIKLVVDVHLTSEVVENILELCTMVWLQPESCKAESVRKALAIIKEHPLCRLGIQAHKYWDLL